MRVIRGEYSNGQVRLESPPPEKGPVPVEVVFLDPDDRRWEEMLNDPTPRPALDRAAQEALEEDAAGRTEPLQF